MAAASPINISDLFVRPLTNDNLHVACALLARTFVHDPRFVFAFGDNYNPGQKQVMLSEIYFPLFVQAFMRRAGAYGVFHRQILVGMCVFSLFFIETHQTSNFALFQVFNWC
jgi:hypothetical protein